MQKNKKQKREVRKKRVRSKVFGSNDKPRISVFRSNKHIYAQLIDDQKGKTLIAVSDEQADNKNKGKKSKVSEEKNEKGKFNKIDNAFKVGENLASLAIKKKIKRVVFDKSGYQYHGRVKAVAEGARKGGLNFLKK